MVKGDRLQCPYENCGKDYLNKCNLNRHINFHHLKRTFVCPLCQKGLSSRQSRDEHMSSHYGEKPYRCPHPGCTETFRQASQLSLHKKLHRIVREQSSQTFPALAEVQSSHLPASSRDTFVPPFIRMPMPQDFGRSYH